VAQPHDGQLQIKEVVFFVNGAICGIILGRECDEAVDMTGAALSEYSIVFSVILAPFRDPQFQRMIGDKVLKTQGTAGQWAYAMARSEPLQNFRPFKGLTIFAHHWICHDVESQWTKVIFGSFNFNHLDSLVWCSINKDDGVAEKCANSIFFLGRLVSLCQSELGSMAALEV
jgi:hypothetical protein